MAKHLPKTVVRAGAGLGLAMTYGVPTRFISGPEGRWVETLRPRVSWLFAHIDERMGPRPITEAEYAGTLDMPPALADQLLWAHGFVRNPLSRLKTLDGQAECGSWVYRTSPLSHRQLHVMVFRDDCARTHVYAHEEASSVNPFVGSDHVNGDSQTVAKGVERARELLPLDRRKETPEPPDGPWSAATETQ